MDAILEIYNFKFGPRKYEKHKHVVSIELSFQSATPLSTCDSEHSHSTTDGCETFKKQGVSLLCKLFKGLKEKKTF
jgi:hypothetical protein